MTGIPSRVREPKSVHRRQRVLILLGAVGVLLGVFLFLPARWGGVSTVALVSGPSMEPTMDSGDLAYALALPGPHSIGDTIVFKPSVADGNVGGARVIHRIVQLTADGRYVTKGDNNPEPDPWKISGDQVDGVVLFGIPWVGSVLGWLGSPIFLGGAAAAIVFFVVMTRTSPPGRHEHPTSVGKHRV